MKNKPGEISREAKGIKINILFALDIGIIDSLASPF